MLRMPAWSRQFVLALVILSMTLALVVPQRYAYAQATTVPSGPGILRQAAIFALKDIGIPALDLLLKIKAGLAAQGATTAALTARAFMVTGAAAAVVSLPGDVHVAPLGYATPGAENHGTASFVENPVTKEVTLVLISNQTKEQALNPDLGGTTAPVMTSGNWVVPGAPYIYFSYDLLGAPNTSPLPNLSYDKIPQPMREWLLQYITSQLSRFGFASFDAFSLHIGPSCAQKFPGQSVGSRPICVFAKQKNNGPEGWWSGSSSFTLSNSVQAKTCPEHHEYDGNQNLCVFKPAAIDDGRCLVSPSSALGRYEYNPADPDCIKAIAAGGMNFQPGQPGGNGAPPVAPSVTLVDPSTGAVLIQEAPSLVDPTAPLARVTTRTPDVANNSTVQNVSTVSPGTQTAANPTAAPVQLGSQVDRFPGTNPSTAAQGPAMQQVTVGNWPSVFKVEGTVTCSNCAQASTGNGNTQPVNVNVPDKVKINGEVPDGVPTDLPTAPTDLKEAKTFLDPVKTKFAGLMDFKLPAHASSCPALNIKWNAWKVSIDVSNNFLCQFLAQHRTLMQGLAYFGYVAASIVIVLGA